MIIQTTFTNCNNAVTLLIRRDGQYRAKAGIRNPFLKMGTKYCEEKFSDKFATEYILQVTNTIRGLQFRGIASHQCRAEARKQDSIKLFVVKYFKTYVVFNEKHFLLCSYKSRRSSRKLSQILKLTMGSKQCCQTGRSVWEIIICHLPAIKQVAYFLPYNKILLLLFFTISFAIFQYWGQESIRRNFIA